jgi:hypothetical protein
MKRKRILVVYYSQTGQLKKIADSLTEPLSQEFDVDFEELRPVPAFPFPWRGMPFFQAFPESVKEIPCQLEASGIDPDKHYDLVILAYQVWYLSPSIPMSAFLNSETGKKILHGRPVVTLLGVRNMWIMAQERVKSMISEAGGKLVGNIVLADPASNLKSVITIVRWMMKGEQAPFRKCGISFPRAGVPEQDILGAKNYGFLIGAALKTGHFTGLQESMTAQGAVNVDPVLYNIEKRGKMMFGIWARMILKKGAYNDPRREGRLRLFKYYLFTVIYLVSPFVSGLFRLIFLVSPVAAQRINAKFSSTGTPSLGSGTESL